MVTRQGALFVCQQHMEGAVIYKRVTEEERNSWRSKKWNCGDILMPTGKVGSIRWPGLKSP